MDTQAPGFEQRLADLEIQIDRLNLTLQHWRDSQDHIQPMERRLAQLTDQCADVLKQWAATGERHAHAVGELEARLTGWNEIEARLQRDASWRFQSLERAIEQEWASLRNLHEEPARQLREQAENLTEICVSTAGSAQTGIERAEARLALLESDLHRRMDDLSRDLQTAVADLRQRVDPAALRSPSKPWSLDEVSRLHQELREGAPRGTLTPGGDEAGQDGATGLALRGHTLVIDPAGDPPPQDTIVEPSAPRAYAGTPDSSPDIPDPRRRWWLGAVAALALALVSAGALAASFYRQAGTAAALATEAQQRAERMTTAANARIEAAQREAAQQIAQARDTASKAQVTSDVLAAPDLIRFNLVGGDEPSRYWAQLLWSRSRGTVFSASRLPAPPAGATYQIWLLTAEAPISAGTFVPDTTGRVTEVSDTTPRVPRPVIGVRVTLEPAPGGTIPSGTVVLARAQAQ